MPQPIETAPKDGTPILTDCGVCQFWIWHWELCSPKGDALQYEQDNEVWSFTVHPALWEPLPDWMKG